MRTFQTYTGICILYTVACISGCNGGKTVKEPVDTDSCMVADTSLVRIKSIHEECFNYANGAYKQLSYIETITYLENGQESKLTVKNENGTTTVTTPTYRDGRLVRRDRQTGNGQSFSICYFYNEEGQLDYITDGSRPKPVERYEYDDNGRMTWKYSYDGESDNPTFANHYEYDGQGHIALETQYDENGEELQERHTYLYDGNGYLLREDFIGRFDGDIHITYQYTKFDSKGNWTECFKEELHDEGNVYKSKTTRKYEYY